MSGAVAKSLETEHDAILKVEKEDECYTAPYGDERTAYIERHYVADFTPKIFENLRFYRRTKGKYKGKAVAIYVDPKTSKGFSQKRIIEKYLKEVDEKLSNVIAPIRKIDVTVLTHIRAHIREKIIKNQKETIARLRKEKQ